MLLGTGALCGYLGFAGLCYVFLTLGANPFDEYLAYVSGFLAFSALFITALRLFRHTLKPFAKPTEILVALMVMTLYLSASSQARILPAAGWDSLDFWSSAAAWLIDTSYRSEPQYNLMLFDPSNRHPSTVVLVQAWSAWSAARFASSQVIYSPWIVTWIAIAIVFWGFCETLGLSRVVKVVLVYCLASIPLLENHVLIGGYAEIFVSACLIVSAMWLFVGLEQQSVTKTLIGVAVGVLAVAIKNVGALYSGILLSAFVVVLLARNPPKAAVVIVVSTMILIAFSVALGLDTMFSFRVGPLSRNEFGYTLFLGNRVLPVVVNDVTQVANNQAFALFINQSFNIIAAALVALFVAGQDFSKRVFFPSLVFVGVLAMLTLSQLLTEYGYMNALPQNDIGNSRFSLPSALIGMIVLAVGISESLESADKNSYQK